MIIGIAGKKRTGKSTMARALQDGLRGGLKDNRGQGVTVGETKPSVYLDSLAAPIKGALGGLLSVQAPQNFSTPIGATLHPMLKEKAMPTVPGMTPRVFLQELGNFMRSVDEHFWINLFQVRQMQRNPGITIIDDVRHENEVDFILNSGGVVIHLGFEEGQVTDTHASETGLDSLTSVHPNYHRLRFTDERSRAFEAQKFVDDIVDKLLAGV